MINQWIKQLYQPDKLSLVLQLNSSQLLFDLVLIFIVLAIFCYKEKSLLHSTMYFQSSKHYLHRKDLLVVRAGPIFSAHTSFCPHSNTFLHQLFLTVKQGQDSSLQFNTDITASRPAHTLLQPRCVSCDLFCMDSFVHCSNHSHRME